MNLTEYNQRLIVLVENKLNKPASLINLINETLTNRVVIYKNHQVQLKGKES